MRWLWKWYLKRTGWQTGVAFPFHHLQQYVLIVGPHTSNWDFIVGIAYRSYLGLGHVRFLGKKELFIPPFGYLFRSLGGIPTDRSQRTHLVEDAVKMFEGNAHFALALSPEGTRRKVEKLKTGFYHIARQAGVPVVMVGLDWKSKVILFSQPLIISSEENDFKIILDFYRPIRGKYPLNGLLHL
jgi:1-acyl-sn-glycerol-3-phosphate acyltransferase